MVDFVSAVSRFGSGCPCLLLEFEGLDVGFLLLDSFLPPLLYLQCLVVRELVTSIQVLVIISRIG